MKFLHLPKPRLRQVLPVAAACVAVASGLLAARIAAPHSDEPGAGGTTATGAAGKRGSRPVLPVPEEAVAAWSSTVRSRDADPRLSPAITISGRRSAARGAAFDKLLALLRHGNATEFHRLLTAADQEEAGLTDEEWCALLEKWGRLDGAGAAACLEIAPDGYRRLPGVIRGWASVDPEAASAWLNDHASPDPAWQTAAQRELAIEPENALERAATVQGPARGRAVDVIARRRLGRDGNDARKGLEAAGHPPEKIDLGNDDPAAGYDLLDPPNGELPGLFIGKDP